MEIPSPDDLVNALADPLADHAHAYSHRDITSSVKHKRKDAISKSLGGLSQFLAVPLDYYSARASSVSNYRSALALRFLFSAAVSGILEGYSRVRFDEEKGSNLLARYQRQWVHYSAFLVPRHAGGVIACVEPAHWQVG